jgi:hypothetical protein
LIGESNRQVFRHGQWAQAQERLALNMSPELAGAVTNGALKAQDEYRHSQRLVLNAIMALHERLRPEAPADEDHSQFRSDRGSNADPVVPADDELLGDSAEFRAAASRARSMPRLLTFQPGQRIKLHHGRHPAVVNGYRLTNPDGPINIPEYDRLRGDCYRWGEKIPLCAAAHNGIYPLWVLGESLRSRMSSIMRWRNGLMGLS